MYRVRRAKKIQAESYFAGMNHNKVNNKNNDALDAELQPIKQISLNSQPDGVNTADLALRMNVYQENEKKIQSMKNLIAISNANNSTKGSISNITCVFI